jgi:GR25 family glycosyltransferase involved in LPS biosynthesis
MGLSSLRFAAPSLFPVKFSRTVIVFALVFVVLIVAAVVLRNQRRAPEITSISVINLDRDVKRWSNIEESAAKLHLTVERFPGIYGKDIPYEKMRSLGVGNSMVRHNRNDKNNEHLVNLGVVGCYLSHRTLLEQVSKKNVAESAGHLILEDDVKIPDDFLQPGGRWSVLSKNIPGDWDMIFLRMWKPDGEVVAPGIMKLRSDPTKRTNLGAFAYIVRHGSLKTKILPSLKYMVDAYDEHINLKFNDWNVYLINPGIMDINDELQNESAINGIN